MGFGRLAGLTLLFILLVLHSVLVCHSAFQGNEDLLLQVSTDKTSYSVGELINISLSLVNPTEEFITLTFRTSKVFDGVVWIYSSDGKFFEKMYDAKDCVFLPVITSLEIKPYSSKEILSLTYSSSSLEAGTYTIEAVSSDLRSETRIEVYLHTAPEFSHLPIFLVMILFALFFVRFRKFVG